AAPLAADQSGEQRERAKQLLEQLDAAVEEGAVKQARPLMRELSDILRALPESRKKDLMQQLVLEQKRLDELRDWMGFAARPKMEELIARMRGLAEQSLDPRTKASRVRELQNEWKQLGGTSDR
ncbi:DUF349 domain-containing protein, partial [Arthrospira platensis SPKY1]|nr:DUF349 domain-containing protein [Arthrospira platensis SPKY1]